MTFLHENFLLSTSTAQALYHNHAASLPIYDYHCHIDAKDIAANRRFANITEVWLSGDHYKWRLMRTGGIPEAYITGDAPPKEKFRRFAGILPLCAGNPMVHWCHMELKNYFGYDGVLCEQTADEVWALTVARLQEPSFSARGLIKASNVAMIGTTDDPCSDLADHKRLAAEGYETKVLPTFRPDNLFNVRGTGFAAYLAKLSAVCGMDIRTVSDIKDAITRRIEYFAACGCRAADHGLAYVMYAPASAVAVERTLAKALHGETPTVAEAEAYQTELWLHCAREYARHGMVMQLHFGCVRNPNTVRYERLGADSGFDGMAVTDSCLPLYRLLDALEREGNLPKTILYSLNPADNAWLDTLLGAFQSDECPGKLQHGSAWWFNDSLHGIREHLTSLASLSVLGHFVGMLTDSRSLLSYARHEYFRRILCDLLGAWVERGEYPDDPATLGRLVRSICADNAKHYFCL